MSSAAKAGFTAIICSVLFWVACNDAFRPIVITIPSPGADPQRNSMVFVLSNNGSGLGALSAVNVSGDTVVTIQYAGNKPVHVGLQPGGLFAYVPNQADDTVSLLRPGTFVTAPTTIPLPAGAQPVFAHSTQVGFMYIAESGRGRVAQINAGTNVVTNEIVVGTNPVALAETPNGQKLYVVNQGSNSVTIIKTADGSVLNTLAVGASPVWAVASNDGQFVFVANSGGNSVTVIDTTNDTAALGTIALGASPTFLWYDAGLKRVYTANTASNSVSIIDAVQPSPTMPTLLTAAPIDMTAAPCLGSSPTSVVALPDGSRAYVANSATNNVCVISSLSNTVTKSIAVGTAPISITSSADGTKVYSANSGSQNISVIRTDSDSEVVRLQAPKTSPTCQDPAPPAPPVCTYMNPAFATH